MIRTLLDTEHPWVKGITLEELGRRHSIRLNVSEPGSPFLPFAAGGFETPSGKCELRAESLGTQGVDSLPSYTPPTESRCGDAALRRAYPLELISPKASDLVNSTFSNVACGEAAGSRLEMHPRDAAARGIAAGDMVRVFNSRGSLRLTAVVDDSVSPGVVCAEAVRWNKRSPDRRNVNVLTSDRLTDLGGGATFYNALVQVEKAGD
jgi:anaerobic selenocysteine-containing dehydrogenase